MHVRITQFTDIEALRARLAARLGAEHPETQRLLAFVDDVKARMVRMEAIQASLHLRKTFQIGRRHVSVTAGTVHGWLPTIWARWFT